LNHPIFITKEINQPRSTQQAIENVPFVIALRIFLHIFYIGWRNYGAIFSYLYISFFKKRMSLS